MAASAEASHVQDRGWVTHRPREVMACAHLADASAMTVSSSICISTSISAPSAFDICLSTVAQSCLLPSRTLSYVFVFFKSAPRTKQWARDSHRCPQLTISCMRYETFGLFSGRLRLACAARRPVFCLCLCLLGCDLIFNSSSKTDPNLNLPYTR